MKILDGEDQVRASLQPLAKQVRCRFEDMTALSTICRGFDLPRLPDSAQQLFKTFYDQQASEINQWARQKGLRIARKASLGPGVTFLRPGGSLWIPADRISISIVIPCPEQAVQGTASQTEPAVEASPDNLELAVQLFTIDVRIPLNGSMEPPISVHSRPEVKVGDVLVLEGGEKIQAMQPWGITLISVVHVVSTGNAGEGGWLDGLVG